MTYPHAFLRLVAAGSLYTHERFSFGLSLAAIDGGAGVGEPPRSVPSPVVNAVTAFMTSGVVNTQARLDSLKLNLIGENGRYVDKFDTVIREWPSAGPQGTGTLFLPPQCSLVATLETGQRRGLATRGRIFIPAPSVDVDTSGLASPARAEATREAVRTLITSLNAAVPGYTVVVASDGGIGRPVGAFRKVTAVRVGRAVDTMQSRRKSIPESYTGLGGID